MIVSEARRHANTEPGKLHPRQDAPNPGRPAGSARLPEAGPDEPRLTWQDFLLDQVDGLMSKLGRCDRLDARHRDRISRRAEAFWDDDRRLEAEYLGSGIARNPAKVARSLRMSPHGCDWMAERWALLARIADRDGAWTPGQRSIAFDLLGRPRDLRGDDPTEELDPEGRPLPGLHPAALARREIAALTRRKVEVAPADAAERASARLEPDESDDADLRKLRRLESDLHRRLRWCVARLRAATPPPPPPVPTSPPPASKGEIDLPTDADLDAMTDAEFETFIARIEGGRPPAPFTTPSRPDPQAARDKARRDERGRRGR